MTSCLTCFRCLLVDRNNHYRLMASLWLSGAKDVGSWICFQFNDVSTPCPRVQHRVDGSLTLLHGFKEEWIDRNRVRSFLCFLPNIERTCWSRLSFTEITFKQFRRWSVCFHFGPGRWNLLPSNQHHLHSGFILPAASESKTGTGWQIIRRWSSLLFLHSLSGRTQMQSW